MEKQTCAYSNLSETLQTQTVEIEKLRQSLTETSDSLQTQFRNNEDLCGKANQLELELETKHNELSEKFEVIAGLEHRVYELQAESRSIASLKENEIQELSDSLSASGQRLHSLETERNELRSSLDELGQKSAATSRTNEELAKSFRELTKDKELLVAELAKAKQTHGMYEAEASRFIKEQNERIKKMQAELMEGDKMKRLEMELMESKFVMNEQELSNQITELTKKCAVR